MYTYIYIYNIPGKDKSLKVAESLFRASEVVNSDGGGYGFSLYKYIYIYTGILQPHRRRGCTARLVAIGFL